MFTNVLQKLRKVQHAPTDNNFKKGAGFKLIFCTFYRLASNIIILDNKILKRKVINYVFNFITLQMKMFSFKFYTTQAEGRVMITSQPVFSSVPYEKLNTIQPIMRIQHKQCILIVSKPTITYHMANEYHSAVKMF